MYALRLYLLVFRGEPSQFVLDHFEHGRRATPPVEIMRTRHAHGHGEAPLSMLIPVGVLSVGAVFGGFVDIPGVVSGLRELDRLRRRSRSSSRRPPRTTRRASSR